MTRTVVVSVTAQSVQLAEGAAPSGISINLVNPEGIAFTPQLIASAPYTATFSNVPAGTGYTATAQTLDVNGKGLSDVMKSSAFDVADLPPPMMPVDVPASISVTVQ